MGHERPRTEQGGSWRNRERVEPPMGTGDFSEAGSKVTSFEDEILWDPESPSVVVQANVEILPLNLYFVCLLQIF